MGKRRRQAPPQSQEQEPKKPLTKEVIQRIEEWTNEAVEQFDLLLFDVEVKSGWSIEITVDSKEGAIPGKGVTVHQCADVSRYVEERLDLDEAVPERYTIEVSSPGLDRPLTKPRHFAFSVGRLLHVVLKHELDGESHFEGILTHYIDEPPSIQLQLEGTHRDRGEAEILHTFTLSEIAKARLTYNFSGDEG